MHIKISQVSLLALAYLLIPSYAAETLPNSIKLSYQSAHDSTPKSLATISYDPASLKTSLSAWTPPPVDSSPSSADPVSLPLVKVLVPSGGSTVTSLATFNSTLNHTISLWLSPAGDGTIFSASISASAPLSLKEQKERLKLERRAARTAAQAKKSKKKAEESTDKSSGNVWIDLRAPKPGPVPVLQDRNPAAVGSDGQEIPEQPEKSFFQKYWWIFLVGAVFALQAGGDK